jgi:hypothetical protein
MFWGGGGGGGGEACYVELIYRQMHVCNSNKSKRVYLSPSIVFVSSRDTIKLGFNIK